VKFLIDKQWKSKKYTRWLRDHADCLVCGASLLNEKEAFETHHHLHMRKNDMMLIPLCLLCHNNYHNNPSRLQAMGLSDDKIEEYLVLNIARFAKNQGFYPQIINNLTEFLTKIDEKTK